MKATRDEIVELRLKAPKGIYSMVAKNLKIQRSKVLNELSALRVDDKYDETILNEFRRLVLAINNEEPAA